MDYAMMAVLSAFAGGGLVVIGRRRERRRRRTLVLASVATVVAAALVPLLPVQPAHAALYQCDNPNPNLFWSEWYSNQSAPNDVEGASATMGMTWAKFCIVGGGSSNGYSSFVQVKAAWGYGGFALAGQTQPSPTQCRSFFGQQQQYSEPPPTVFGACISGSYEYHHAWVQEVGSGQIRSNIDTTIFMQSPWNIFNSWHPRFEVRFAGASIRNNTDVPGYLDLGTYTVFESNQVQKHSTGDNWVSGCQATNAPNGADSSRIVVGREHCAPVLCTVTRTRTLSPAKS